MAENKILDCPRVGTPAGVVSVLHGLVAVLCGMEKLAGERFNRASAGPIRADIVAPHKLSPQRAARGPSRPIVGALVALYLAGSASVFPAEGPVTGFISRVAAAEPPQAAQIIRDCNDGCPEMVVVPAGTFTMGSTDTDSSSAEGPTLLVKIGQSFAAGKFEVTFAEWDACVAARGCQRKPDDSRWGRGNRPVIDVSWDDAQQYVGWLSRKTGKIYRLLTEAEWEYAARAGSTTRYSWGDNIGRGNANCVGCGGQWDNKQTAPVGSYKPNAFGLYDMHGNVWEWVEDCWQRGYSGAPSDGRARTTGCPDDSERVTRGGGLVQDPSGVRSTVRNNWSRDGRANGIGFRVARNL